MAQLERDELEISAPPSGTRKDAAQREPSSPPRGEARARFRDGIQCRPAPGGTTRFYYQYRDVDGVRKNKRLEATTFAEARKLKNAILHNIACGRVGIVEPTTEDVERARLTVKELSERFTAKEGGYSRPKIKDLEAYRKRALSHMEHRIGPRLGTRAASSLTVGDVERLRDSLLRKKKDGGAGLDPSSVMQTLATISKMYEWARRSGLLTCANPARGVERPSADGSIDYLSRDEATALLVHAAERAPGVFPMIATAIYAGLRKGELLGLRWTDVQFEAGSLHVARSYGRAPKSGRGRHVPLNPELTTTLRAWRDGCPKTDEGLVFPTMRNDEWGMGGEWQMNGIADLLRDAKCHVPAMPWHALRHTFASHFMMAGGNILTLQRLLGHSTLAMTMRYAHLAPDFMRAEVARMSFAPKPIAGVVNLDDERRRKLLELLTQHPELATRLLEELDDAAASNSRRTHEAPHDTREPSARSAEMLSTAGV